jgi:hypothetical protein
MLYPENGFLSTQRFSQACLPQAEDTAKGCNSQKHETV